MKRPFILVSCFVAALLAVSAPPVHAQTLGEPGQPCGGSDRNCLATSKRGALLDAAPERSVMDYQTPYPLHLLAWAPEEKDHSILKNAGADSTYKPYDPWLGWDKVKHFTFSFLFTVGGQYALVNKAGMTERSALPVSMSVAAAIGIGKELSDRARGKPEDFSMRDIAADAAGILLAAGLILL